MFSYTSPTRQRGEETRRGLLVVTRFSGLCIVSFAWHNRKARSSGLLQTRRGQRPHGSAQGRDGERQRIELLIIPQLGEVKTYRSRIPVLPPLHPLDEPSQAFFDGRLEFRLAGRGEESFDGEGGFFDG